MWNTKEKPDSNREQATGQKSRTRTPRRWELTFSDNEQMNKQQRDQRHRNKSSNWKKEEEVTQNFFFLPTARRERTGLKKRANTEMGARGSATHKPKMRTEDVRKDMKDKRRSGKTGEKQRTTKGPYRRGQIKNRTT